MHDGHPPSPSPPRRNKLLKQASGESFPKDTLTFPPTYPPMLRWVRSTHPHVSTHPSRSMRRVRPNATGASISWHASSTPFPACLRSTLPQPCHRNKLPKNASGLSRLPQPPQKHISPHAFDADSPRTHQEHPSTAYVPRILA